MVVLAIAKAETVGEKAIGDVSIVIEASDLSSERMASDARVIVDALHDALPQGTWNRLVAEVAQRWAANTEGRISAGEWYG